MKKSTRMTICIAVIAVAIGMAGNVYALPSLGEVVEGGKATETVVVDTLPAAQEVVTQPAVVVTQPAVAVVKQPVVDVNNGVAEVNGADFGAVDELIIDEKVDTENSTAQGYKKGVSKLAYVTWGVSILIMVALAACLAVDLLYIKVHFLRKFLANGFVGNSNVGGGGAPGSEAQMGGMSGGFGGQAGGFGGGRFGRPAGVTGGNIDSAVGGNNNTRQDDKIQLVSNLALNCVASESTLGADGKPVNGMKNYLKRTIFEMVLIPAILALNISGILPAIGIAIGKEITEWLSSFADKLTM